MRKAPSSGVSRHLPPRGGKEDQPDLFEAENGAPKPYVPKPQHVRNRFIDFMAQMTAAPTWPWDEHQVEFYRMRVWPYLYERLPDAAEAAEWKQKMEAEAARLDAARLIASGQR